MNSKLNNLGDTFKNSVELYTPFSEDWPQILKHRAHSLRRRTDPPRSETPCQGAQCKQHAYFHLSSVHKELLIHCDLVLGFAVSHLSNKCREVKGSYSRMQLL